MQRTDLASPELRSNGEYKPPASQETQAPKAEEFIPWEYLVSLHSCTCNTCGALSEHAEVHLVYIHPRLTATTRFRRKVPVDTLEMDLPIVSTQLRPKRTPVCAKCFEAVASQRETKRRYAPISERDWADALRAEAAQRRAEDLARAARRPSTAKPRPSPVNIDTLPLD